MVRIKQRPVISDKDLLEIIRANLRVKQKEIIKLKQKNHDQNVIILEQIANDNINKMIIESRENELERLRKKYKELKSQPLEELLEFFKNDSIEQLSRIMNVETILINLDNTIKDIVKEQLEELK